MDDKKYTLPTPVVDRKEVELLEVLTKRYEAMTQPSTISKLGNKIGNVVPKQIKQWGQTLTDNISEQELYRQAMELIAKGFKIVEEQAAKYTISEHNILQDIDRLSKSNTITGFDEVCLARSYEISRAVNSSKNKNRILAFVEGGATGAGGFWGLPFNLVLSTLLYFRAVESIAMYYGFDAKNDAEEMIIAGEVFKNALDPAQDDVNNEMSGIISKIMVMTQASIINQTSKKTWTEMATKGGIPLLLTQMRALAHKSAQKALENAGKNGLENSIFKDVFEQIGRKLTLKNTQKVMPIASAIFGALIDTAQMHKVLEYADIFYQKRFIISKVDRISMITNLDDILIYDERFYTDTQ